MRNVSEFDDTIYRYSHLASANDAVNLCSGAWTEGTPSILRDALREAAGEDAAGYPPVNGVPALRKAIAEHYRLSDPAKDICPDQVTITSGVTGALALAFTAVLEPNEEIILPRPFYGVTEHAARAAGMRIRGVPAWRSPSADMGWRPDIEMLHRAITKETAALVITDPDNPTGAVLEKEEWAGLKDLAASHNLFVIVDRTYERFGLRKSPVPTADLLDQRTFIASSASKSFRAAGLRIGWLLADATYGERFGLVTIQQTGGATSAAQTALALALCRIPPGFFETQAAQAADLCELLSRSMRRAGITPWPTDGGLFLNVPARSLGTRCGETAWERLLRMGIGGVPSAAFGSDPQECESFVRLSFARPRALLDAAISRLASSQS
jgi:N-succinyldiaminopimelate aminotransferase